jgi:rhamnose transport system permease protein
LNSFISRYKRELAVALAYVALLGVLGIFAPTFFRSELANTWVLMSPVLIAAVGMNFVIVARQIDISIGAQFSICGVLAGLLAKMGLPMPMVAICVVLCGALMGMINGTLVAIAGLPSIVVTLATMVILRQSLSWIREGEAVNNLPASFQWFGLSQRTGELFLVVIAAIVTAVFAWGAKNIAGGRAVFAVGSDSAAARLAGIRPRYVTFNTFVLLGGAVGFAALLNAVRFPQVDVNAGNGLELAVIAAVVVGGTAINGGRGTLLGTVVGVALLASIGPALTFLHLPAQWERAVQGLIILIAVASDRAFGKRSST